MKKTILSICWILCFAVTAAAQQTADSLLVRYRQMALAYSDDLKIAAKNISASIELERAARADRLPKLSASGEFRYTGNPTELTAEIPQVGSLSFRGENMRYGVSATLSQPIYTGGRILETIRIAESQHLIAEAQQTLLTNLVCFQVDIQYWNTVARFELLNIATDFRNSIEALTRIVRERVEAGVSDRQELLTAEVKLNEAEFELLQLQNDFETSVMALNALIGVPLDERTPVGNEVQRVVDQSGSAEENASTRPEILMAKGRIDLNRSHLRLNDAQYLPQLYAGASGEVFSPGYNFRPDLSPNYAVYLQVAVPIFEGGKRRREKRAYAYRVDMAEDELHRIEQEVELETNTARLSFRQAERSIAFVASSLDKTRENERRATEKYEEGAISIADVIDAQVYRQTAEINLVTAKVAARIHYAELLKSLNGYDLP